MRGMGTLKGADMAHGNTSAELDDAWQTALETASDQLADLAGDDATDGFGSEFRELARQRRFVRRSAAEAAAPDAAPATASSTPVTAATRAVGISSRDAATMFSELSGTVAQLGAAREELARQRARADHAELQLTGANERLMAARVLVHDAQRATHMSAERCAWLEGRNEALSEALDRAVNASMVTRWRWRRQLLRERLGASEAG